VRSGCSAQPEGLPYESSQFNDAASHGATQHWRPARVLPCAKGLSMYSEPDGGITIEIPFSTIIFHLALLAHIELEPGPT
jgi:hypothetical protein